MTFTSKLFTIVVSLLATGAALALALWIPV
jgi:hypothetical protein